jgi:hypothetical protein
VQRCGHKATRLRDELSTTNSLAGLHYRPAGNTDMLTKRHHVMTDEWNPLDRQIFGLFFEVSRMNPVIEVPTQQSQGIHDLSTGLRRWCSPLFERPWW